MAIARKVYPFVTALFLFPAASVPAEAQTDEPAEGQLICGWCIEMGSRHYFTIGGELCGWEGRSDDAECSRCRRLQNCHKFLDDGPCHRPCGPDGDAVAALTEIHEALEAGDMSVVASTILRERTGVHVQFIPEGGRIDLFLPCDPNLVFRMIPVGPATREALEVAVRAYPEASAGILALAVAG